MLKGIHLMDQGSRRHDIERWYQRIERWAANRLLVIDAPTMSTWGRFYAKHQRTGRKLPLMDSLLAATALQHELTIVTRNTTDFPDEVTILNPWPI
jgi:predicted nucleic acid-binding protein